MENYFNAKKRLFTELLEPTGTAVLNSDQAEYQTLSEICKSRKLDVISYGKKESDIQIINSTQDILSLEVFGQRFIIQLQSIQGFQIYNACCALGLSIAIGTDPALAVQYLSQLQQVPGRLETVALTKLNNSLLIDYAHTPDALETVLQTLKKTCQGRIILVFGCGGDRDQGKRAIMGEIAARLADLTIITDDNPRSEEPAKIRGQISKHIQHFVEIGNRSDAIRHGIESLNENDILLVSGKGHENYQIINEQKIYFSDRETILNILNTPL